MLSQRLLVEQERDAIDATVIKMWFKEIVSYTAINHSFLQVEGGFL